MKYDIEAVYELMKSAAVAHFRICHVEGEEHPDRSWQRVTCHLHREDVSWGAVPLIYVIGAQSFGDARPRGSSDIDYLENDEWRFGDMIRRLRLERGTLAFDADYVRGRMMKTRVTVGPDGRFAVETRNRHEMAVRWLRALKGKKHLRLVEGTENPATSQE
jgi:hypothetical protein